MATSHKKKKRARRHGIFNMIKKKHTADSKFYTQNKKEKKLMQVK